MIQDNSLGIDEYPSILQLEKKIGLEVKDPIILIIHFSDILWIFKNLDQLIRA